MFKKQLLELGVTADLDGLVYLNEAIRLYKPLMKTGDLMILLSEKFNKNPSRISRNILTAIEKTGQNLTVGQFIAKYSILWNEV
jgi:hypothetical protein